MATQKKNILFIMYDQLRFDYLSCAGHPHLHTPNFDRVAAMGVRFTRAYVQSPVCGSSRMSYYTGRYAQSHGAHWNGFPLKVGEMTLGDHLRDVGMDAWLIGKTHMKVDKKGMERLGLAADSIIGARVSECGFDVWVRDDGLWAQGPDGFYDEKRSPYNEYLKSKGYTSENGWHDHANAGISDDGDIASGFLMQNAGMPANILEKDSETPWLTDKTIGFMEQHKTGQPWLAHVSYIKPHWPYIVPAPYHNMYGKEDVVRVIRSDEELIDQHPVFKEFTQSIISTSFHDEKVRETVIPAYMGLIKQCDDQLGRLLDYLEDSDQLNNTMIVLTSDHGDYLGDHWKGEKDLFHEQSVKVPMIIYDPSELSDSTRGTTCDALVEAIDLSATFVTYAGGQYPDHIIEGKSLLPFLHGEKPDGWREYAISEYDYSATNVAQNLNLAPKDARLFMVVTKRWKFMHSLGGYRPMLFDLTNDPNELVDLGQNPQFAYIRKKLYEYLLEWALRPSQRTTKSDQEIYAARTASGGKGILLGLVDGSEVSEELISKYLGSIEQNFTSK
ncbi:MAG: sulfatase-like hydrolase/transferase [Alphaproteobacteria bacterium]|nr:sulfatase-like hydrolase/transferase [Alphaproteobacteria bacterium]